MIQSLWSINIFNRKATFCELNDPQMNIRQNLELRSISWLPNQPCNNGIVMFLNIQVTSSSFHSDQKECVSDFLMLIYHRQGMKSSCKKWRIHNWSLESFLWNKNRLTANMTKRYEVCFNLNWHICCRFLQIIYNTSNKNWL